LLVERQVDEGVEADDGLERRGRELDLGGVGMEEPGRRDEPAGTFDLDGAEVDAGDRVPGAGQVAGERDAAATAEIQDRAPAGTRSRSCASQVA
jgi:hypothetical protein